MTEYKVVSFVYHTLPTNDIVLQNLQGIVRINNENLISLIKHIDENHLSRITYEELKKYMSHETDNAIEFLKRYRVIEPYTNSINYNVKRIQIISNNDVVEENIMHYFSRLTEEVGIEIQNNSNLEAEIYDDDLVVVFLNPYDRKLAKEIYNRVQDNEKSLLLMSYIYKSNFYMDNLYSPKWKNPCHYCHMGYIESQLRINEEGALSYQKLIDVLYHEDSNFSVEAPITTMSMVNIITLILNRLDNLVFRTQGHIMLQGESLEDLHNTTMYDLVNRKTNTDTSIHWEMCNCYE